jgi:hypothetical protein
VRRAATAGAAYFAVAFAAGFALGAVRVTVLVPRVGEMAATLAEIPIILAVSWVACGWATARWRVPADTASRAAMGATALAMLLAADMLTGLAMGIPLRSMATGFAEPARLVGLAAQLVFAALPLLRR